LVAIVETTVNYLCSSARCQINIQKMSTKRSVARYATPNECFFSSPTIPLYTFWCTNLHVNMLNIKLLTKLTTESFRA